ncbi:putative dolichyl-phosphate beta-D-mannosyltransferase [Helianthus annuus]|nr:putative dolichyl-phosphate beta-D-mannosyltransferase [Helianthus annuus]
MELAYRAIGFILASISVTIFTYYTFWVIVLVSYAYFLISFSIFTSFLSPNFQVCDELNIIWLFRPFVDEDHFVHNYFLAQEYAILLPVYAGVCLICFLSVFIGYVMLKSKKKKA